MNILHTPFVSFKTKAHLIVSYTIFLIQVLTISSCSQPEKINFYNSNHFIIDNELKMILLLDDELQIDKKSNEIWLEGVKFTIFGSLDSVEYQNHFKLQNEKDEMYDLYLSKTPIININPNNDIDKKERKGAVFTLKTPENKMKTFYTGVSFRGGHTMIYPKKSLRLEFWKDPKGRKNKNVSLLNMRSDDDWILQAMYNEPLRLRDKSAFDLWAQIIDFQNKQSISTKKTIKLDYVDVFFQNEYQGVYVLCERPDRKKFNLNKASKKSKGGELIKGRYWELTTFDSMAAIPTKDTTNWGGFEFKYPKKNHDWSSLDELISFIKLSDDDEFYKNIHNYVNIDNVTNYFIFINVLGANDNTGKNVFLARYNQGSPYFYIPWDLDAILGYNYLGERYHSLDRKIISNKLFDRLFLEESSPYKTVLIQRWKDLISEEVFTIKNILETINKNHNYLSEQKLYEREQKKWKGYTYDESQLEKIEEWIKMRMDFLEKEVFYEEKSNDEI